MSKIIAFLKKILGLGVQYGQLVNTAVKAVAAEVAGTDTTNSTKKEMVVTYVLAAAHAGEQIPIGAVEIVSGLVDTAVHVLETLGVLPAGKDPTPPTLPAAPKE
jgi:hypothetical protein